MQITATTIGVGLLLFSNRKILTVRELKSKPHYHKFAGMMSFPLETYETEDKTPRGTIDRLLKEELGIPKEEAVITEIIQRQFFLIPGKEDVVTIYGFGFFLGDPKRRFQPMDNDIEVIGWKTPEELMSSSPIRIEVIPIITDFLTRSLMQDAA